MLGSYQRRIGYSLRFDLPGGRIGRTLACRAGSRGVWKGQDALVNWWRRASGIGTFSMHYTGVLGRRFLGTLTKVGRGAVRGGSRVASPFSRA